MPIRTELEWAKEICRQQGYVVIQKRRIEDIYTHGSLSGHDLQNASRPDMLMDNCWMQMAIRMSQYLMDQDIYVKDERYESGTDHKRMRLWLQVVRP